MNRSRLAMAAVAPWLLALCSCGDAEPPDFEPSRALLVSGDVAGALATAETALDRSGDDVPLTTCDAIEALALAFYEVGTIEGVEAAERLFERSLAIREQRLGEAPRALGQLLHDLSGLAFNSKDLARAEAYELRALEVRERAFGAADAATIESRRDLGWIFTDQGRLAEARPHLEQALAGLESAPAPDRLAIALARNYLAELDRIEGRHDSAEARLVELVRAGPEQLGEGRDHFPYFLNNLAGVYRDLERFDEAETLLRRSLELREAAEPRDDGDVAVATLNLAELNRAQGKLDVAEPLYVRALELAVRAHGPDNPHVFEYANQLGVLHRDRGDTAAAEPLFAEALRLAKAGGDDLRIATAELDLAELQRARGRCDEARRHQAEALAIRERVVGPEHPSVAEALVVGARCLAANAGSRVEARRALDRAIAILERTESQPLVEIDALALRAELLPAGDAAAEHDLTAALEVVEALRPHRGGGEGSRAVFLDRYVDLYSRRVRQEIDAGRPARALEVAERARARVLLDQLATAGAFDHVADGGAADRQEAARARVAELRQRIAFEGTRTDVETNERVRRLGDLGRQLDDAMRELRARWDETRNASPAWRAVAAGPDLSAEELQRRIVPPDGAALVYSLGTDRSWVFLAPPPPARIEAFALSVSASEARALGIAAGPLTRSGLLGLLEGSTGDASGMLARLAAPRASVTRGLGGVASLSPGTAPDLHALWRVLVPQRLWLRIASASRVVVVPEGPLCLLPFEALVVEPDGPAKEPRYWLDDGPPIRYAPSATALARLAERDASRTGSSANRVLSVSDPAYGAVSVVAGEAKLAPLPGTARESRAIAQAFAAEPSRVVLLDGPSAREAAVRREIGSARWIHLATHGFVDERADGLFAALAFAPPPEGAAARGDDDGLLELYEIYQLDLDSELAVLSACRSNAGRLVTSEGVFALSRGFLVAGARSVVASQWAVDDASTAELIGDLFRRIATARNGAAGVDVTLALRDAKRSLRRDPRWAHPFFWAPFVLTGLDERRFVRTPGVRSHIPTSRRRTPGLTDPTGDPMLECET